VTHYTAIERIHALRRLKENYGDVPLTSLQTRIPERTLYTWKRQFRREENLDANLRQEKTTAAAAAAADLSMADTQMETPNASTHAAEEDTENEYVRFRDNLIQHIDTLLQTLSDDPDLAHRRAIALTRLLDKVVTLGALVKQTQPITIRYEFRQFDGSLAPTPPFQVHDRATDKPRTGKPNSDNQLETE
jgi:hypothetical protein